MKLQEINGKFYISIYDLLKIGFDYPPKGTKGILNEPIWVSMHSPSYWYSFYEKDECGSIWVSPFSSGVGKKSVLDGDFFIEFCPAIFQYQTTK